MAEDRIRLINIEEEMKSAYIDYSMSVIVARALPDVRDGLKPVHRRVLYGMSDLGLTYGKAPKKSARIVGEVLGKYHPHGDTAVYDSMVRMAQDWSLRYPLVDGQGNYGSMDGDSPAAMRYTEARLEKISEEILADIKKDTVDWTSNFDDTLEEPSVLPTRLPTLLVNGASGIAVGMATNMLPHNLTEVCNGIIATVNNPDIDTEGLMEHIKAPDLPTGGTIYGYKGVKEAFETGRGRVVVRGKARIEEAANNKETIIIHEIPYQVNKANLVIKIADLVTSEKIKGISDVRDESDRNGIRIVVEVKRDFIANVILSQIYKYSPLQSSYGVNNIALVEGRPETLNLKRQIEEFIKFRIEVITRRTEYDLRKAKERAHILEGLIIALDNIDEVIKIIRASKNVDEAREGLMSAFGLSELQAKAILEMRLQKLTGLERDKLRAEFDELMAEITRLEGILGEEGQKRQIIIEELEELIEKYGDERRTDINYTADGDISIEDIIPNDEVIITISHLGYIKRTRADEYKVQSRGGRGSRGSKTRSADFLEHMFVATNHNYLLLFTERGMCHWLRIFEIPEASKAAQGRVIQNIIALPKEDKVRAYIVVQDLTDKDFLESNFVMFATREGVVKKTALAKYSRPRTNGIIAINIREEDELIEARIVNESSDVMLANSSGYSIRFSAADINPVGRNSMGVRGMKLKAKGNTVVGMIILDHEQEEKAIMVISEKGTGKRTESGEYKTQNRGGKGIQTIKITKKTGELVAIKLVAEEDDLMITSKEGIVIRLPVSDVRLMGRSTQGVRMINLDKKDDIADVAVVKREEDEDGDEQE